eukprot:CAMPEP_0171349476 /NCGR_PEP_ID=MMETSP0878-20121228/33803_1 /TAXON_ID=67004 /ORGANISM="Thalassiosira weissflogii, Strain CCMP1336" /LENGTH=182 /DNA_ID=CAMNT_0011854141 /DNA_START=463 /DNA_END=1011 /DNA_ORIENTATION=+
MNNRIFTAIALTVAPFQKGCSAFTSGPIRNTAFRSTNALVKSHDLRSAFFYSSDRNSPTEVKSTSLFASASPSNTPTSIPLYSSVEDELQSALEHAQEMDKKHGLCTEPSQRAWEAVDEIYHKMQAMQTIESPEKKRKSVRVRIQNSSGKRMRKVATKPKGVGAGRAVVMGVDKMKGRQYYF